MCGISPRLSLAIGVIGTLVAGARADEAYDLRGPALVKGQVIHRKTETTVKNADLSLTFSGTTVEGKMDVTGAEEAETEILALDRGRVVKQCTKVIKDENAYSMDWNGRKEDLTRKKVLIGQSVVSEQKKDGWEHTLEFGKPDTKELKELRNFDGLDTDNDRYPGEKVQVGHVWNVEATALKVFVGPVTTIAGKGKAKFLRLEKFDNEECAVIEIEFDITATQMEDDRKVKVTAKCLIHRSLASGIDRNRRMEGAMTVSGVFEEKGSKIEQKVSGKGVIQTRIDMLKR